MIPGAETDPAMLAFVSGVFAIAAWAKAWCRARTRRTSSPTASAVSSAAPSQKMMVEDDFTIEEVDALTGPLIGLPNSASFRLLDIVGLDVWAFVGRISTKPFRTIPGASVSCRRFSEER
jgi:3-hydroxyacyl-CoA dehydrogenase